MLRRLFSLVALVAVLAEMMSPPAASRVPPPTAASFAPYAVQDGTVALVMGDFGSGSRRAREVSDAMEVAAAALGAEAIITTGDNLYSKDVNANYREPFAWIEESGLPIWVAWGNHDIEDAVTEALVQIVFAPPGKWYSQELGEALVVFLDGNQPQNDEQNLWLEETLAAAGDRQIVVVFHQPPLSCSRDGGDELVRATWESSFQRHGVDLVLNGHEHNYQRITHGGITYVITGGGGRSTYPISPQLCSTGVRNPDAFDDESNHFVTLAVSDAGLTVTAFTPSGRAIDAFRIPA